MLLPSSMHLVTLSDNISKFVKHDFPFLNTCCIPLITSKGSLQECYCFIKNRLTSFIHLYKVWMRYFLIKITRLQTFKFFFLTFITSIVCYVGMLKEWTQSWSTSVTKCSASIFQFISTWLTRTPLSWLLISGELCSGLASPVACIITASLLPSERRDRHHLGML